MKRLIFMTALAMAGAFPTHAQTVNKGQQERDAAAILILTEIAASDCKVVVDVSARDALFTKSGLPVDKLRTSEAYGKAKAGMWDELKPMGITQDNICAFAKGVLRQKGIGFVE